MVWFALAIGAALLWSAGGVLVKKGFQKVTPLWNNILGNLLSLVVWVPAVLLLSRWQIRIPPWNILLIILTASLIYLSFYYSLSKGRLSLTGTLIAGYPVVTILFAHLFLGERLLPLQYTGVALTIAGGVVVAFPERTPPGATKELSWVLWGLLGASCLGTGDFLSKFSMNRIGSYSHIFFLSFIFNLGSGVNYLLDRKNRAAPKIFSRDFLPTFLGIIIHLFGALFFLLALGYGPASLVSSVSSIYPALTVLLAVRFLRETVTLRQGIGIGSTVAGIVAIGLGQP